MKNDINISYDSSLSHLDETGGNIQEWKRKTKECTFIEEKIPQVVDIMEDLKQVLKTINPTDVPLFLNPKTATFLQVAIHAKIRQFKDESTIEKHLRYARFMETHNMPIDFRNLTPEMFLRHMDYRLYHEDPPATPNALKHEKRALLMFLTAFKQYNEDWKMYIKTPPIVDNCDDVFIPSPSVTNRLYHAKYSNDKYENILFQTIVFTGINFGMRPPSEICNLNIDDLVINIDGTGYIKVHEQKKHGKIKYKRPWNKSVLSSKIYRTPRNYVDTWRPIKENIYSGNALFLQKNGKRITAKYMRDHISNVFKVITGEKKACLYTMRHTYATYYYQLTKDIALVAEKLGHHGTKNTDKYIHVARDLEEQSTGNRSLFNQALRSIKPRGKQDKIDYCKKRPQSRIFTPRKISGPAQI
jgi:integrase